MNRLEELWRMRLMLTLEEEETVRWARCESCMEHLYLHKRRSFTTEGVGYHVGGLLYPEIPRTAACMANGDAQF